jgi:putative two-component system hydrogenase maturation factor HypX/HoxX
VGPAQAIGLVDEVGPRHPDAYAGWLADLADRYTDPPRAKKLRLAKQRRLDGERLPLDVYEQRELAEMSRDMFDDRHGFAAARQAFVRKVKPTVTPAKLAFPAHGAAGTRHVARPRQAPGAEVPHLVRPSAPGVPAQSARPA